MLKDAVRDGMGWEGMERMMHQLIQGAMAVVGIFLAAFPVGVSAEIVCFDERYAQTIKAVQQIPQTGRRIFPTPGKRGVAE